MKPGISAGVDKDWNVRSARLMGDPGQCLQLELPLTDQSRWCTLPWPHEGDHVWGEGHLEAH